MRKASELKFSARKRLAGHYGVATGIIGVYMLIRSLGSLVITENFASSIYSFIFIQVLVFGFNFLMEFIRAGLCKCFLDLSYGIMPNFGDLFICFRKGEARKYMTPALVLSLIPTFCMLPSNIMSFLLDFKERKELFLVLLVMVAGFLVEIYFNTIYSQVYYVGMDIPEKEGMELLKMSKWLMQNNFWKYVWLCFSFVPMYFLCLMSMGIGFFWVLPYMETSRGLFYLELTRARAGGK